MPENCLRRLFRFVGDKERFLAAPRMRKLNPKLKSDILEAARLEFLAHGFMGAQLREIAGRVNATTGSIYKANAIVEYVGGIQVVKAFSQSAGSYKKYADAVNYNAGYYVNWMRDNQKYMCMWTAVIPAVLVTVLPVGVVLWSGGNLETGDFLTIIVLSLGLISFRITA